MLRILAFNLQSLVCILFINNFSYAACDCGSESASSPCTGSSISVDINGGSDEGNRSVNFTWQFHSGGNEARCGQFANGDYWVAPADGQSNVTVTAILGFGGGPIFADENPVPEAMGFLSRDYGNLTPAENIIPQLPQNIDYATSLVAAIQRDEVQHGNCGTDGIVGGCVDAYNVVTILPSVPENAGSTVLRPNILDPAKELLTWDDFDLSRLPSISYFSKADASQLENIRKTWSYHTEILSMRDMAGKSYSEGGRAFRADLVTDDYAATVARDWHNHLTYMVAQDSSFNEIKTALAAMLTYGKDIFYHTHTQAGDRRRWFGVGAGQSMGRYPAAVFFAALSNNSLYATALTAASANQVDIGGNSIHELDQANIGPNGPVWGDHDTFDNQYDVGRYWGEMLRNQKFDGASGNFASIINGKKTFRDPYKFIDGPGAYPGSLYGSTSAGPIRGFAAMMLLIPEMCDIVNYDAVVEYAIRLTEVGIQTANDPCAPPDPRENPDECNTYHLTNCKYYGRNNIGVATWGPDPADWSKCITNGTDPITGQKQYGRFSSRHGESFNVGYKVTRIEENWEAIRNNRNGCRNIASTKPQHPGNLEVSIQP